MRVLNGFSERCYDSQRRYHTFPDNVCKEKKSELDFVSAFDSLIRSLSEDGWESSKYPALPVFYNKRYTEVLIKNGAHRVAAMHAIDPAGYVPTIAEPVHADDAYEDFFYEERVFQEQGLAPELLDALALEYVAMKKHVRALCLFPSTHGLFPGQVKEHLARFGSQVVRRDVWLKQSAGDLFVQHLYLNEHWIEEGSWMKTDACFCNASQPLTVFFVEPYSMSGSAAPEDKLIEVKNELRELFDIGECLPFSSDKSLLTAVLTPRKCQY